MADVFETVSGFLEYCSSDEVCVLTKTHKWCTSGNTEPKKISLTKNKHLCHHIWTQLLSTKNRKTFFLMLLDCYNGIHNALLTVIFCGLCVFPQLVSSLCRWCRIHRSWQHCRKGWMVWMAHHQGTWRGETSSLKCNKPRSTAVIKHCLKPLYQLYTGVLDGMLHIALTHISYVENGPYTLFGKRKPLQRNC